MTDATRIKKPRFWFAILGLLIMIFGFLISQATQIPFVLNIVASDYVDAKHGAELLFKRHTLVPADRGFEVLAELYINQLQLDNEKQLYITQFDYQAGVTSLIDDRFVHFVYVTWSNGRKMEWTKEDIMASLEKKLKRSVFLGAIVIFLIGVVIEITTIALPMRCQSSHS